MPAALALAIALVCQFSGQLCHQARLTPVVQQASPYASYYDNQRNEVIVSSLYSDPPIIAALLVHELSNATDPRPGGSISDCRAQDGASYRQELRFWRGYWAASWPRVSVSPEPASLAYAQEKYLESVDPARIPQILDAGCTTANGWRQS
ncbi:MAG TPA: hypothetical protein VMV93_00155 [Chloroflexota bacterium]|nr:hypothetical protein [Chloroflexota bacterium]